LKRISLALTILVLAAGARGWGQTQAGSRDAPSSERWFFPKDFLRGYADFAVAPPHNEPDLGRCALSVGLCSTFPRYVLSGYLEFQPVGRGPLRRLFVFFEPDMFFGDNIPQQKYTASLRPMALSRVAGLVLGVSRHLELRISKHEVNWFGRYARHLGAPDLGSDKPMGQYATIGVRWYFGGWGRRPQ